MLDSLLTLNCLFTFIFISFIKNELRYSFVSVSLLMLHQLFASVNHVYEQLLFIKKFS